MKQLRFTTSKSQAFGMTGEPLVLPDNYNGEAISGAAKHASAYIHGEAEDIAGYDIPIFIDGDFAQLDQPVEEQDIVMLLPQGEYPCIAQMSEEGIGAAYLLTIRK